MIIAEEGLQPVNTATLQEAAHTEDTDPTRKNYLKAAEEYQEENYNCIDGRMSTQSKLTPGDDTDSKPEQRPSILEKLHSKQAEVFSREPASKAEPTKSKKPSIGD